ncbi:IS4 family transposase [Xanthomonas populi]
MRASEVLQRCLADAFGPMHALRERVLLKAVEALTAGWRLTLIDLARRWPGAERVRAPLKALDRLLSNGHLHAECLSLHAAMARWLLRGPRPLIVIDWSDLKADKSWCLLRAAVPVGGRTLTLLDRVHPGREQGSPGAERQFLQQLRALIPEGVRPILITDAGFRTPWFRAVQALGWSWVGRLRGTTLVKPADVEDHPEQWVSCRCLWALVQPQPRELDLMQINRSDPLSCRLVVHGKSPLGRKHYNRRCRSEVARSSHSRKAAASEREPWLIIASPDLVEANARQLVGLYARRMQIEGSFRDLKSHRYGAAFEDSLTRQGPRLSILLMLNTLASFACWLAGMASEQSGHAAWLVPCKTKRKLYSTLRIGREALLRCWPLEPISQCLERLRTLPEHVYNQMVMG